MLGLINQHKSGLKAGLALAEKKDHTNLQIPAELGIKPRAGLFKSWLTLTLY